MINKARERMIENWPNNKAAVIASLTNKRVVRIETKEGIRTWTRANGKERRANGALVPRGGIEPPTLRFSVACSTN